MVKGVMKALLFYTAITLGLLTTSCATISKKDVAKFFGGGVTGLGIHEGSHYIAANTQGMKPKYRLDNPTEIKYDEYEDKKDSQKRLVSSAGLVGQIIATEVILNTEKIPKDDSYVLGILAFTIGNNLRYGLFPNLRGKEKRDIEEKSDIERLDKVGIKKEYAQTALIAHSAFSIYRLMKNKDFKSKFNFDLDCNKNKLEFKVGYKF